MSHLVYNSRRFCNALAAIKTKINVKRRKPVQNCSNLGTIPEMEDK